MPERTVPFWPHAEANNVSAFRNSRFGIFHIPSQVTQLASLPMASARK
jgi:hypothetical protein